MRAPAKLYSIAGPWAGRLAIVPRPRGGDWLDDEVQAWKDAELDIIVSLLTAEEAHEFNLEREQELLVQSGLDFRQFAIADQSVPSSADVFITFVENLDRALAQGKKVGIHCRQSLGRSSMLAAALLGWRGVHADEAFQYIALARGKSVPETEEQSGWIAALVKDLDAVLAHR